MLISGGKIAVKKKWDLTIEHGDFTIKKNGGHGLKKTAIKSVFFCWLNPLYNPFLSG
jgi:hypothetical protein